MDASTIWLGFFGLIGILAGLAWFVWGRGPGRHATGGVVALVGVALLAGAFFLPAVLPTGNTNGNAAVPGGTYNNVFATTPALPTGCTFYQSQNNVFCTVVFNSTTGYLAIQSSVAATFHNPVYIVVPFNMIRTDNANTTFTESTTLSSLPTFNSLGSSPQLYGPIGYKAATSSVPGQWQAYADQGTQANQKPTVSAPGTSSNVISTSVPVKAFASQTVGWHLTLAGSNSTSFPNAAAQAWANNTDQIVTFTFGGPVVSGSFTSFTLTLDLLGWHV